MTDFVQIERRGPLTQITLDRPAIHNAFDENLIAQLTAALEAADAASDVRLVVLTGAGKSFSAGADLEWMRRMAQAGEQANLDDALALARLMRVLNGLSKPTVARVNGAAFGGGVGLIACCDVAIGVEGSRFALTETRLGLVPAVISPYVIAAIGARQARRLFVTAELFDAAAAERFGLLHRCVAADQLDSTVNETASRILESGPIATAEAKRLVARLTQGNHATREWVDDSTIGRHAVDHSNAELIARLRVSPEGQEGLTAFLDKRPPRWINQTGVAE